jgi:integrase
MNRKHLTPSEYELLKQALKQDDSMPARILELIVYTGMRQSEALALTHNSLDVQARCLKVKALKDSESRLVPMSLDLIERVKPLFNILLARKARAGDLISNSLNPEHQARDLRRIWSKLSVAIFGGYYGVSLHGLRHSWALRIFEVTKGNLLLTQKLMGHKNMNSTAKYLQYFSTLNCRDEVLKANE